MSLLTTLGIIVVAIRLDEGAEACQDGDDLACFGVTELFLDSTVKYTGCIDGIWQQREKCGLLFCRQAGQCGQSVSKLVESAYGKGKGDRFSPDLGCRGCIIIVQKAQAYMK